MVLRRLSDTVSSLSSRSNLINPYRARIRQFPGRIFCFEEEEHDLALLRETAARYARVYLELGSGSGAHLVQQSRGDPAGAFFGIERRFKRAVRTIEKSEDAKNSFVLRTDIGRFPELFDGIPLCGIWVNFPDPWEKKRSRKHRTLSAALLDRAAERLAPGGFLSVKSDHGEYFTEFRQNIEADSRYVIEMSSEDLPADAAGNVLSEFERLFRAQKLPIYGLKAHLR